MKTYFKHLIYYSLSLFDSVVNFCCSIFGFYPKAEISENFLIGIELSRVGKTISVRNQERVSKSIDAKRGMHLAKSMLEYDDYIGNKEI